MKHLIVGLIILIVAIVANLIAARLKILSWYDFLTLVLKQGSNTWGSVRWQDWLWLFLVYPFLLGAAAEFGRWINDWIKC